MHERQRGIPSAAEAAGETDPHGRPEELLDPHVERPEDAIELVVGDRFVGDLAGQEDGVLLPDGEGRSVELEVRSEEHTSELQSLMRISYAVFCLKNNILHYDQGDKKEIQ